MGVIHPYVLVSKSTRLKSLSGEFIITNPTVGCVKIGFPEVVLFDESNCKTIYANSGKITIDKKAHFGCGTVIRNKGQLDFGEGFSCTGNTEIICSSNIKFGKRNLVSWDVLLMDDDQHKILDLAGNVVNRAKPITIGDDVWIGCRTTILKGAVVPNGNVIAAGSVISGRYIQENSVLTSNKKILRSEISWIR